MKTIAFGAELNLRDPSWPQLDVLTRFWSEENLAISHSVQGKQRYFFPGIVQSFVKDIALLQSKKKQMEQRCAKCQPAAATKFVGRFTTQLMQRLRLEM